MSVIFIPNNEDEEIDPNLIDAAIQLGVAAEIINETGGPNGEAKLLIPADEIDDALMSVLPEPPDEDNDEDVEGPSEYQRLCDEFQSPHPAAIITYLIQKNCLPCDSDDLLSNEDDLEEGEGEGK